MALTDEGFPSPRPPEPTSGTDPHLLTTRYFWANIVYLLYGLGVMVIDYGPFDDATDNNIYIATNLTHALNAALYAWSWKGRRWNDWVVTIEYLNVVEAGLYLWSSAYYPYMDDSGLDSASVKVRERTWRPNRT